MTSTGYWLPIAPGTDIWQSYDSEIRGYTFEQRVYPHFNVENQQSMAQRIDLLNAPLQEILKKFIAEVDETEEVVNMLKTMKGVMDTAFGKENNQIVKADAEEILKDMEYEGKDHRWINTRSVGHFPQDLKNYTSPFRFIIRFPEITISNSKGKKRVIKELYVKVLLKHDCKFRTHLTGLRTLLSKEEYHARYWHSHLAGCDLRRIDWSHFCLGSGEITQVLSLLSQKFDEVNFTMFCIHLNNYVRWESIEGSPYYHMENVSAAGMGTVPSLYSDAINNGSNLLKSYIFSEDSTWIKNNLKFSVTGSSISIETTPEVEKWAATIFLGLDKNSLDKIRRGTAANSLVCLKDTAGNPVSATPRNGGSWDTINHQTTPVFKFKGEDKYFKVEEETEKVKTDKYAHPQIMQELCRKLSREFTKVALGAERTEVEKYSSSSKQETARSDIFPM